MSNRVRVQQLPHGLYNVSIPRALAQALRIEKGDVMEWVIENGDLILKRVADALSDAIDRLARGDEADDSAWNL